MEEKRYIISEASARTGLEAHVLRYWEEQLGLVIERNEMGHRYYSEEQLNLFIRIKELKEKGLQLKAIKTELSGKSDELVMTAANTRPAMVTGQMDKMDQFKAIIGGIVTQSLRENNAELGSAVSGQVSEKVIKEMDYLLRMKEEAEENRYKKLDETIRNCQKSNKEAAAMLETKKKRRR